MLHDLLPWETPPASAVYSGGGGGGGGTTGGTGGGGACGDLSSVTATAAAAASAGGGGEGGSSTSSPGSDDGSASTDGPAADTVRGVAFLHLHGRDLAEAWEWVQRYQAYRREADILQVGWECGVALWCVVCDWLVLVVGVIWYWFCLYTSTY